MEFCGNYFNFHFFFIDSLINYSNDESQQCQSFTNKDFSNDQSQQCQSFTNENSSDTWHFKSLCKLQFVSKHNDSAQSSKTSSEQLTRTNYVDDLGIIQGVSF